MAKNRRLRWATSSPAGLLAEPLFWIGQPGFAAALLGALGLGWLLVVFTTPHFTIPAANPALWIHLLVFWGIAIAVHGTARIQVEKAVAEFVFGKASDKLRGIESHQAVRPDLNHVERQVLPDNPHRSVSMLRLFQQVIKEAKDRKFNTAAVLMQPYREESYSQLFRLQTIQKIALQLGILGTFVGLILALYELRIQGGSMQDFGSLLDSLTFSFGTSIAGIEVSIILGFLTMGLRRRQESYFGAMEEATIAMCSLTRKAINKDEYLLQLDQVQSAVRELSDRVLHQATEIEVQTKTIGKGLQALSQSKDELDRFLERLSDKQEAFVEETGKLYAALSPSRFVQELSRGIEELVEEIRRRLSSELSEANRDMEKFRDLLSSLCQALEQIERTFGKESEEFRKSNLRFRDMGADLYGSLERVSENQKQWLGELQTRLPNDLPRDMQAALKGSLDGLSESLSSQQTQVLEEFRRRAESGNGHGSAAEMIRATEKSSKQLSSDFRGLTRMLSELSGQLQNLNSSYEAQRERRRRLRNLWSWPFRASLRAVRSLRS